MTVSTGNSPELIAGDLAIAIHQGSIRDGERLPSQAKLARSYGVSSGTAAAALAKLAAAGLIRTAPGSGTYATTRPGPSPSESNPVLDVMTAASICRTLAGLESGPGESHLPALATGGIPRRETVREDGETMSARRPDVGVLAGLDRHVLQWMSEALVSDARRLVAHGMSDADQHLIESAHAILRDGGRRPAGQPAITPSGDPQPAHEDVVLRIRPEHGASRTPDGPPFQPPRTRRA